MKMKTHLQSNIPLSKAFACILKYLILPWNIYCIILYQAVGGGPRAIKQTRSLAPGNLQPGVGEAGMIQILAQIEPMHDYNCDECVMGKHRRRWAGGARRLR